MILALAHPVPAASNSHRHPRHLRPASARGRDQHGLRIQAGLKLVLADISTFREMVNNDTSFDGVVLKATVLWVAFDQPEWKSPLARVYLAPSDLEEDDFETALDATKTLPL